MFTGNGRLREGWLRVLTTLPNNNNNNNKTIHLHNSNDISSPQSTEALTNDIRERAIEVRGFLDFGFFVDYSYNYLSVEWSTLSKLELAHLG